MATRTKHTEKHEFYFCTLTCYNWISLFEITIFFDQIEKWFKLLPKYNMKIVAFVMMPNHLHFIIYIDEKANKTLNTVIANAKRFWAYEIVNRLQKRQDILTILRNAVTKAEKIAQKKHRVFIPSFDARICLDKNMIIQKLNYIHLNPVRGKWLLTDDWTTYPFSSALYYEAEISKPDYLLDFREYF